MIVVKPIPKIHIRRVYNRIMKYVKIVVNCIDCGGEIFNSKAYNTFEECYNAEVECEEKTCATVRMIEV